MITHSVKFSRPVSGASLVQGEADLNVRDQGGNVVSISGITPPAESGSESPAVVEAILRTIADNVRQLQHRDDTHITEFQALSIRLATMMVENLVGSVESMKTERLETLLNNALKRPEKPVGAFVHPDDFSKLGSYLDTIQLDVQPMDSVAPGECRIDYSSFDLVSSLKQQLAQIESKMLEVIHDD